MSSTAKPETSAAAAHPADKPADGEMKKLRYRADIQGMRAVAVMLVVADHLEILGFKGGFLGVDVFFVISGFLITYLLAEEFERNRTAKSAGWISIKSFYIRRARRILPASMLVIAAVLIAAKLQFNIFRFEEVQSDALWATIFLANFDLMRQATDYFAQTNAVSPLQNYWSLAVEEQFYIVWPLVFMLAARVGWTRHNRKSHDWRQRATIAIVAITALSLIWSFIATNDNPASAYFSPFTRAYELGIGATIAILAPRIRGLINGKLSVASGLAGLALIALGLVVLGPSSPYPGLLALIPTIGAGLLIIAGLQADLPNPVGTALSVSPARFLGKISYSIYLWHWPIIVFAASLYPDLTGARKVGILLPLIIVVSWVTYVLIEQPFRTLGKGVGTPRKFIIWARTQGQLIKVGAMGLAAFATLLVIATWARPMSSEANLMSNRGTNVDKWANWDPTRDPALADSGAQSGKSNADGTTGTAAAKGSRSQASEGPTPARIKAIKQGLAVKLANPEQLQAIRTVASNEPEWLECSQSQGPPAASCSRDGTSNASQLASLSGKTAVLLGNSYAEQWAGTIIKALPAGSKLTSLASRGCLPFDLKGLERVRNAVGADCGKHASWALEQIKRLRPAVVIISTDQAVSTKLSYYLATREMLRRIQASGAKVLWIGTAPRATNWDQCLTGANNIASCSTNDRAGSRLDPGVLSAIQASGAGFWNLEPLFCVLQGCPALIDSKPVRLDGSHFTQSAMNAVLPQLTAAIQSVLRKETKSTIR